MLMKIDEENGLRDLMCTCMACPVYATPLRLSPLQSLNHNACRA